MKHKKILVIGGGAAGMMAALSAAEEGCRVTIWERNNRLGKKLLSTGNGKCNFSNRDMGIEHYYGSDLAVASGVLERFGVEDTVRLFGSMGMLSREKDGFLYPYSEQASTVPDILQQQLHRLHVSIETGVKAERICRLRSGLLAAQTADRQEVFDSIILACGGRAAPKTGSDGSGYVLAKALGHTIITP
ncbi:MAG: FAD-dependent oxidoreductase, partial [Lachnospiraceae bacterium]|nr:FAD-dependent oxidoreductase [Lachnospiraceae bacterium]